MTRARRRTLAFACLCAGMAFAGAARAQVHKCTGADGKPVYQSEPCDGAKPVTPAPQSAPRAAGRDPASIDKAFRKAHECLNASDEIENIIRYRMSDRASQGKIDSFRRDCQELGFRYPDSASSAAYNKTRMQELTQEYMQQYQGMQAAPRPSAKPATVPADLLPKAGRCADLSRSLEDAIRQKATYSGEGAAMIVEFRSDCQQLGYKFPDTKANVDFNRARFHELLQESAQRR